MGGSLPPTSQPLTEHVARYYMYNYIPHPSNCRVSSAILSLRIDEGAAGYGVYWMILELLRDAPAFKYSDNHKAIAFAINEHDTELVYRVIHNYGLFDQDENGLIFSPWLIDAMGAYSDRKTKLQEAGRKGAAKRWAAAHASDGQAIAPPSLEDGQAIAYNITQPNITQPNITQPSGGGGSKVSDEYVQVLLETSKEGHAPGYVAQVCKKYGCLVSTCEAICEASDNAKVDHPIMERFRAIVAKIQREKWTPSYPDAFFTKKVLE